MKSSQNKAAFEEAVKDLLNSPDVQSMKRVSQHVNVNCYEHCVYVAYVSFLICRFFKLDSVAAARGGLLHDMFLYDWRKKEEHDGLHFFSHPKTALRNASLNRTLSEKEKDIILKHMWPVTLKLPRYKESFVVGSADKLCALAEMLHIYHLMDMKDKLDLAS